MKDFVRLTTIGDKCCGCGACAAKCPKKCIAMEEDDYGFRRPKIDSNKCIECGICDATCPVLNDGRKDGDLHAFWAKAKEARVLDSSSSGGIFGLLAAETLNHGGMVVGAAWDSGCRNLRHVCIDSIENLDLIMRSKYVQSIIDPEVFMAVEEGINEGKPVLFSGTACQVSAIRSFLGKKAKSDLFTSIDVICHGVPSPKLWRRWADYIETSEQGSIVDVNFRSKTTGWQFYSVLYSLRSSNDVSRSCISTPFSSDWYMRAFLQNASLRPSCFSCPSKRACGSDITLGDYWGIQVVHPEVESANGVSAVIVNSEKGQEAIRLILDKVDHGNSTFAEIAEKNPALVGSVQPYQSYHEFQEAIMNEEPIVRMTATYGFRDSLLKRLIKGLTAVAGYALNLIRRG